RPLRSPPAGPTRCRSRSRVYHEVTSLPASARRSEGPYSGRLDGRFAFSTAAYWPVAGPLHVCHPTPWAADSVGSAPMDIADHLARQAHVLPCVPALAGVMPTPRDVLGSNVRSADFGRHLGALPCVVAEEVISAEAACGALGLAT